MTPYRTRPARAALRGVVLLLALLLPVTACTLAAPGDPSDSEKVTVLGPWTGDQERRFTDLLKSFGVPFAYQGTAAQREMLLSQVQTGSAPHVAIMPGVGELAEYAERGRLKPLDKILGDVELEEYGPPWQPRTADGMTYWVPVKADLKSIVWHRRGVVPPAGPVRMAAWCTGMGDDGASGWPGSDWIEDVVLQSQGRDVYEKWATGHPDVPWTDERIVRAWRVWGTMAAADPEAAERALLTDHRGRTPEGGGLLFDGGGCILEHQGSFARAFYGRRAAEADFTDSAPLLPGGPYRQRGYEVSADFAVLFNDTPLARELLKKLVSQEGQARWAGTGGGGVFSARSDVSPKGGGPDQQTALRLTGGTGSVRCLDASDVMSPAVRDAFYDATLRHLADTEADPGDRRLKQRLADIQKVQEEHKEKRRREGRPEAGLSGVCEPR
ncbi:ABC transporter substrate-binding protein [Streptomyces candidus]|uniref:Alpha-glucoside transport system substrate-binding protein n=1 Tax=Streptomyces candidus TaxID=67283 RepID=A0A7X0HIH4_9ACTN|nr:ABC transporter substrate-binding protein [Streptomyces candidus]MBB6438295.1 alpha-glucoside transport system substrate-binding protein [Streptomyces candidus]GHH51881.1 ABC transporter substrate-binding protein [Streptomyces candidus]